MVLGENELTVVVIANKIIISMMKVLRGERLVLVKITHIIYLYTFFGSSI